MPLNKSNKEVEVGSIKKKKGCMEMLPRFKIQYPMKNRGKDENENLLMKEENYSKFKIAYRFFKAPEIIGRIMTLRIKLYPVQELSTSKIE